MNYKNIFKNKEHRLKILEKTNFIPDDIMIRLQYKIKTGRKLDLNEPKRYSEKIQWYKLNYRDPLMIKCADKFSVREYVSDKGLSEFLNPLYAVYSSAEDIDFNILPNSFAIKFNNGAGMNIFVEDKEKVNVEEIRFEIKTWFDKKNINYGREWAYYDIPPKITIEKLMDRNNENDIPDYKFFCFDGKVEYLYTMIDYVDNHEEGKCSFYDRDFNKLPFRRSEFDPIERELEKPKDFDKMIEIAERLSEDFPHARVDLYNLKDKITFGEITFYNASGYTVYEPDEFDFILGNKFILPSIKNS